MVGIIGRQAGGVVGIAGRQVVWLVSQAGRQGVWLAFDCDAVAGSVEDFLGSIV